MKRLFFYPLGLLWHIWFLILNIVLIVLLLPGLYLFTFSERLYPYFFKLARLWAYGNIYGMGWWYDVDREAKLDPKTSYMIIGNHTSMVDIMMTYILVPSTFVFVGKASLAKIPLFGPIYKRSSILVDRSSNKSRANVYKQAAEVIEKGGGIAIFPEGGVPDESVQLAAFKDGAFSLAMKFGLPIVPITYGDHKRKFPYSWYRGAPGRLRVTIHEPIETNALDSGNMTELKQHCYTIIKTQLDEYGA